MTARREFLTKLGAVAAGVSFDSSDLVELGAATEGEWDNSWIPKVEAAKYRVVFNTSDIADGAVFSYAGAFLDGFRETHNTSDADTRAVSMFRRLGTVMALNDAMWDRFQLGADRQVNDPLTKAPARRNIFWNRPANQGGGIEQLQARGLICLACNVSLGSMSMSFASKFGGEAAAIKKELVANLVPGAIVVPSGIYALIRAQNAGCAFMAGT